MFNRPGIVHESVAGVLTSMGVKNGNGKTNPPNNGRVVKEGLLEAIGMKKKPITEQEQAPKKPVAEGEKPDETDGEPGTGTKVGTKANTKVNTDAKNTSTVVDVDAGEADTSEACATKEKDGKAPKDGKKPEAKKEGEEDKSKVDESAKPTEKQIKEAIKASESFYESLDHPVSFILWESEGKVAVEVHGLTNEELAPFGGNPPAISPKYAKAAKDGGSKTKGSVGELMLYSTMDMNTKVAKLLAGKDLGCTGFKTPAKGTGRGTLVIGGKD